MKVAVHFAEGFEEIEALAPVDILRRAEIECVTVSVTGNKEVSSTRGVKVLADKLIDDVDYSDIDMLILPGGMPGTKNLGQSKKLLEIILKFYNEKKWLAAICAAPSVFGELGILKNETAVCYPGVEEKLEGANIGSEKCVVSNKIITSKGPGTAMDFSFKIVEVLKNIETAEKLKKEMIYY